MDIETLAMSGLVKLRWVGDRLGIQDVKPRHVGRAITADVINGADIYSLVGTLEGREGSTFIISGKEYPSNGLQNVRIWRSEIEKD